MKSIFEPSTREELVKRIGLLSAEHKAQWGKMNAFQVARHCVLCEDMFHGTVKINRVFIGRLIGPMVLRKVLKDDKPFGKNSPTAPVLKIKEQNGDIELQKKEWVKRIEQYMDFKNEGFIHPFFGPMTKEQIGWFAYKHSDHHLRQFSV
jgi:hypothetical protein